MDEDKKRRLQELANKQSGQQNNVNSQQPTNSSSQANPKQKYSGPVNNSGNHGNDYQNRPSGFDQSQYKTCKYCGTRIPANAKICPNCRKRQGMNPVLRVVLIILAVVVVIGILGSIFGRSGEDDTKSNDEISAELSTAGETEATQSATEEPQMAYEITYQNCDLGTPNQFDGKYYPDIIVQIQNTGNTNLYLKGITINFKDDEGNLIGVVDPSYMRDNVPQIIQPGEYGYFYSSSSLDGSLTEGMSYTMEPVIEIEETDKIAVLYEVSDANVTKTDTGANIIGQVTNNTDKDDSMVGVYYVFFDANGHPIGIENTVIDDLPAGNTQSFSDSLVFMGNTDDIESWEVYAFPYQYQF